MALGYAVGNDLIADKPIALTRAAYDALSTCFRPDLHHHR